MKVIANNFDLYAKQIVSELKKQELDMHQIRLIFDDNIKNQTGFKLLFWKKFKHEFNKYW